MEERKYEVWLPAAYYEVFFVKASSKEEALKRVKEGTHDSVEQNCMMENPKWDRKPIIVEK